MDITEAPAYFLCPISLQPMKDPVTVSSGITYDRENIQKWLFSLKNTTCPVTKQPLSPTSTTTHDLMIPNLTLRRLIHHWSTTVNRRQSNSPEPHLCRTQIAEIIADPDFSPHALLTRLRRLWSIAMEGESSRKCMEDSGVVQFLISILYNENDNKEDAVEEALVVLYHMNVDKSRVFESIVNDDIEGEKLVNVLLHKTKPERKYQTRVYATMLLRTVYEVMDPTRLPGLRPGFFSELVRILRDRISYHATMSALKTLARICTVGRNRTKAAEAGGVIVVIDLLMENLGGGERRPCEILFTVLDQLCGCAEGRAELLGHPAGLTVVGKKMIRVSSVVSERAVRVVEKICRFSGTPVVLREMAEVGVVEKLLAVAEEGGDGGGRDNRTRNKAIEILKLHSRVWKSYSSSFPSHLLSSHYFQ